MKPSEQVRLMEEVLAQDATGTPDMDGEPVSIPIDRYLSRERLERERDILFRHSPLQIGFASEVREPGQFITHRGDVSLLCVRGADAVLRAFLNVCRHRGTELVDEPCGRAKAFACPYHAWTYGLDGALVHVPHSVGFPELDRATRGLVEVPVFERFGLVFAVPSPRPATAYEAFFGGVLGDLASFGLDSHVLFAPSVRTRKLNWKLMLDGSFESYHFRVAHRRTIASFFLDNRGVFTWSDPHLRMVLPKRSLLALRGTPVEGWRIREHANILYYIHPHTIVLVQPDHAMVLSLWPTAPDETVIRAGMLVPETPTTEKAERYWRKNEEIFWSAIEEDIDMGERIQRSLRSGANSHLLCGRFEHLVPKVHATFDAALGLLERGHGGGGQR